MEKAKIIFNDQSELTVEVNGDCYITKKKPSFPDDLTNISIEGEQTVHFDNAVLVECASVDKMYWFTFIEKSKEEIREEELLKIISEQNSAIDELTIAILEG